MTTYNRMSGIASWLSRRRAALRTKLAALAETTGRIGVTHGFLCLGITLFILSVILPVVTYRARCRYGLSNVLVVDALLSLFRPSGFAACLDISHDKAVQALREFPPVYAIILSVQAAGLIPVLRSQPSRSAVLFAVASSAIFIFALTANLYWVIEASYGGANVAPWQFAALIGLFLFGAAFTFLLLDQVARTSGTKREAA